MTTESPDSVADLVSLASQQVSQLVREELRLAQAEMKQKGKRFGVGGGLFGAAGVLAFLGLETLVATAVIALAKELPWWGATLAASAALALGAGAFAAAGRKAVRRAGPPAPEQAVAGLRADVATIKENAKR